MSCKNEEPHDGQVIHKEKKKGFPVIEEYEMIQHQHIAPDMPGDKGVHAVAGKEDGKDAQDHDTKGRRFSGAPLCQRHYYIPVKSQMQRHENETPVGGEHMQAARQGVFSPEQTATPAPEDGPA